MLAQALQIWGVFWQSHLKERTYSPGSRDSGTSTRSPNTHLSPSFFRGGLITVHWDPSGVVYLERSKQLDDFVDQVIQSKQSGKFLVWCIFGLVTFTWQALLLPIHWCQNQIPFLWIDTLYQMNSHYFHIMSKMFLCNSWTTVCLLQSSDSLY